MAGYGYIFCMGTDAEQWLTYRWQKGNRYYGTELRQDLFGAWILKRIWDSLHTHRGQNMTLYADNYDHAIKLLRDVEKRRKRGATPKLDTSSPNNTPPEKASKNMKSRSGR